MPQPRRMQEHGCGRQQSVHVHIACNEDSKDGVCRLLLSPETFTQPDRFHNCSACVVVFWKRQHMPFFIKESQKATPFIQSPFYCKVMRIVRRDGKFFIGFWEVNPNAGNN
ncbi:hypothetical protein DTC80_07055 [Salmonella enterica]|nr:hypothetical protein [Salmonella enterica]